MTAIRARRLGRLERPAIAGVLVREAINFSSFWRATTFSSTVEPTIYLLAFGFGFGALVSRSAECDYVEFVATGTVATAVLFSSVFPAMFGTFVKYKFQRTYDAILAAPVDTEELVTAEALWIALARRCLRLGAAAGRDVFGLDPAWGMLTVPFIGFLTGLGAASLRRPVAAILNSIDNFNYVTRIVITPMFLRGRDLLPARRSCRSGSRSLAQLNPLYHCVELVRHARSASRAGSTSGTSPYWPASAS